MLPGRKCFPEKKKKHKAKEIQRHVKDMAVPTDLCPTKVLLLGLIPEFKGCCPPIVQHSPSDTPSAHFRPSLPSFPAWIQAPTERADVFTHRITTSEFQIPIPDLQPSFCPLSLAGKPPSFGQTLQELCSLHSPVSLSLPNFAFWGLPGTYHVCQSRSSLPDCKTLALVTSP